jgi:2-oxoglutarate ferredoxin oxidoreductase subunit delta
MVRVNVVEPACTGCEICVESCPFDVLEMIYDKNKLEGQVAAVSAIDKCTECMLCELNCPHFAIFVEPQLDLDIGVKAAKAREKAAQG